MQTTTSLLQKQNNDARALVHLKIKKMAVESRDKTSNALLSLMAAYEVQFINN